MDIKNYVKATTLEEAYQLLNQSKQNNILGGGLWMKYGKRKMDTMIDISNLGLNQIEVDDKQITIGSQVTLREMEIHPDIISIGQGFLSKAISVVVGVGFRNLATIGGTIVGKYPFSDVVAPMLCLDVKLKFYPEKEMTLYDFLESKDKESSILTHIIIKKEKGKGFFKKVSNTIVDFSILSVSCYYEDSLKVVIGSRPGKPLFATKVMEFINKQKSIDQDMINQVDDLIKKNITFGDDDRGSKEYREVLAITYVKRGIKEVYPS